MKIKIPISTGELIDKITILEIKSKKIKDKKKLVNINKELTLLDKELRKDSFKRIAKKLAPLKKRLFSINTRLWNIENRLRKMEADKKFNKEFIKDARAVYINNDKRSEIKRKINLLLGSDISEVKEYSKY